MAERPQFLRVVYPAGVTFGMGHPTQVYVTVTAGACPSS
jgi:hypothetical protein